MIFEKISLLIRVLWPIDKKNFVHFLVLIKKSGLSFLQYLKQVCYPHSIRNS